MDVEGHSRQLCRQDHLAGGLGLLNLTGPQEPASPRPKPGQSRAVLSLRTKPPGEMAVSTSRLRTSKRWGPQPDQVLPSASQDGKTPRVSPGHRCGHSIPGVGATVLSWLGTWGVSGRVGKQKPGFPPCGLTALGISSCFCRLTLDGPQGRGPSQCPPMPKWHRPGLHGGSSECRGLQAPGLSLSLTPVSRCSAGWLASDTRWWAAQTFPRPRLQAG